MHISVSRFLENQTILRHPENPVKPLVSIIMPTYRLRADGMNQRAIESVLNQTLTDFEFIIVDDGSLDGLSAMLVEYQRRDPRIIIIRHELNSGLPALRVDEGILLSRGRYLAYIFEDDEWYSDCLERLVETAQQNGDDCAVYGIVDWIIHRPNGITERSILGDWEFNYGLLKNNNKMANCAVLHPRSVVEVCGLYDPHILIRRASDYDLWLRMGRVLQFRRCAHTVGQVASGISHSLGKMVDQDLVLTLRYIDTDRDMQLHPKMFSEFEIDSLDFISDLKEAHRVHENYIIPFWVQHPRVLSASERKMSLVSKISENRLLVTKSDYSTSIDVTMTNYSRLLGKAGPSFAYVQECNLPGLNRWTYNTLVLFRTIGNNSLSALHKAHLLDNPVIYFMDDNMFKFGTGYMAESFEYLKPDSANYQALEKIVAESDLAISFSPQITRDIRKYNPRVIELSTNIREHFILKSTPLLIDRSAGRRMKYAILTGPARTKELQVLWGDLVEFSSRHADKLEFQFWGIDPAEFGGLPCPVSYKSFNHSYDGYLRAIVAEKFDFVLCPLFDDHETKISKSPIKFLEITASGAIGIFSNVAPYSDVVDRVTGLKSSNEPGAWLEILEASWQITEEERHRIFSNAKAYILENYTTETQVLRYLSAFEAANLHHSLSSRTASGGCASIAYFVHESLLGGATLHLMHHLLIMKQYGFHPILCVSKQHKIEPEILSWAKENNCDIEELDFDWSTSPRIPISADIARAEILKLWFNNHEVRFVHMVTYMADVALASYFLGIPCLATLHAFYDPPTPYTADNNDQSVTMIHSSSRIYARKWQSVLDKPAFCIRAPVSGSYFQSFNRRDNKTRNKLPTVLVSGTLQPRKGQLKAIQAIGNLAAKGQHIRLLLSGYDTLVPEYQVECRKKVQEMGLESFISILGFSRDEMPLYEEADYLLCSSDDESFPQSILKGMASGLRIISTPVGGVEELIVDGFSGIVSNGFSVDDLSNAIHRALELPQEHWDNMLENAYNAVCMTSREDVVAYKLLTLYNLTSEATCFQNSYAPTTKPLVIHSPNTPLAANRKYKSFILNEFNDDYPFLHQINRHRQTYRFSCPDDGLIGIRIRLSTRNSVFRGRVVVTIRLASQPQQVLRTIFVNTSEINLQGPQNIMFPVIRNSRQVVFLLSIDLESTESNKELYIYESIGNIGPSGNLIKNMSDGKGVLCCHLLLED